MRPGSEAIHLGWSLDGTTELIPLDRSRWPVEDCPWRDLRHTPVGFSPAEPLDGGKGNDSSGRSGATVPSGAGGLGSRRRTSRETVMTADKGFKRLVRERAERTGEAYAEARRRLLDKIKEADMAEYRHVEDHEYGFAIDIPVDWERLVPDVAKQQVFFAAAPPHARPFVTVTKWGVPALSFEEYVAASEASLRATHHDVRTSRVEIRGRHFARAEYYGANSRALEPIHQRAVTTLRAPAGYVFNFATADPAGDAELLDHIESSIRLL